MNSVRQKVVWYLAGSIFKLLLSSRYFMQTYSIACSLLWFLLFLFKDLTSGIVPLKIYSGDLMIGEASVTYHTDMEEISSLLANAANPVQFMCQVMTSKQLLWKTALAEARQVDINVPWSGLLKRINAKLFRDFHITLTSCLWSKQLAKVIQVIQLTTTKNY